MGKNTINIYLQKEERKQLDTIKQKYQLSLTTIVDILCFETYHTLLHYAPEQIQKITETYQYEHTGKTSIKRPHIMDNKEIFTEIKHRSRFATNVVKIYLYKDIKKYVKDNKGIQMYWNKVNEKMEKTQDTWWAYNQHIRYERRSLKENKEYYKAEIEKMEHGKRD